MKITCILILIQLCSLVGQIVNKSALGQKMAWYWTGDKPLSKPMMAQFTEHMGLNELMITRGSHWRDTDVHAFQSTSNLAHQPSALLVC